MSLDFPPDLPTTLAADMESATAAASTWLNDLASLDEEFASRVGGLDTASETTQTALKELRDAVEEERTEAQTALDAVAASIAELTSDLQDARDSLSQIGQSAHDKVAELSASIEELRERFAEHVDAPRQSMKALETALLEGTSEVAEASDHIERTLTEVREHVAAHQTAINDQLKEFTDLAASSERALTEEAGTYVRTLKAELDERVTELERRFETEVRDQTDALRVRIEQALVQEVRPLIARGVEELRRALNEMTSSVSGDTGKLRAGLADVHGLIQELDELPSQLQDAITNGWETVSQLEQRVRERATGGLL